MQPLGPCALLLALLLGASLAAGSLRSVSDLSVSSHAKGLEGRPDAGNAPKLVTTCSCAPMGEDDDISSVAFPPVEVSSGKSLFSGWRGPIVKKAGKLYPRSDRFRIYFVESPEHYGIAPKGQTFMVQHLKSISSNAMRLEQVPVEENRRERSRSIAQGWVEEGPGMAAMASDSKGDKEPSVPSFEEWNAFIGAPRSGLSKKKRTSPNGK